MQNNKVGTPSFGVVSHYLKFKSLDTLWAGFVDELILRSDVQKW